MSKLFVRSRPLARIAPILFGTWLVLPGCSAKVELGQTAGAGGTAGVDSTGGASVGGGGIITDGGSATTNGGSIAYPNTSTVAGSGAYTTSIVGVGGATVATTSAVSSFLVQQGRTLVASIYY